MVSLTFEPIVLCCSRMSKVAPQQPDPCAILPPQHTYNRPCNSTPCATPSSTPRVLPRVPPRPLQQILSFCFLSTTTTYGTSTTACTQVLMKKVHRKARELGTLRSQHHHHTIAVASFSLSSSPSLQSLVTQHSSPAPLKMTQS